MWFDMEKSLILCVCVCMYVCIYFVLVSTFQTGNFCNTPALDKLTKANVHKRLISILQFAFIMIHLILNTCIFNSHKTVIRGTAEGQTGLPPLGPQTCPNRTESSGSPFCPTFTLLKCSINTIRQQFSRCPNPVGLTCCLQAVLEISNGSII